MRTGTKPTPRGADEEAASLGAHDGGDALAHEVVGNLVNGGGQALRATDKRGDVLEDDSRLRIVGDVDDEALKVDAGHGQSFLDVAMCQDRLAGHALERLLDLTRDERVAYPVGQQEHLIEGRLKLLTGLLGLLKRAHARARIDDERLLEHGALTV